MAQLAPVTKSDKPILDRLYQLYLHDFSVYTGQNVNNSGLYDHDEHYNDFWEDPRWNPFFIYEDDGLAGFVVVLFENYDVDPDPTHVIWDFMVLRKYRRKGIGREAAILAFNQYKANWAVAQMGTNEPAIQFWRSVIGAYTGGRYTETYRADRDKYIQSFSTKERE
jgi:predicted acetyltransferase